MAGLEDADYKEEKQHGGNNPFVYLDVHGSDRNDR